MGLCPGAQAPWPGALPKGVGRCSCQICDSVRSQPSRSEIIPGTEGHRHAHYVFQRFSYFIYERQSFRMPTGQFEYISHECISSISDKLMMYPMNQSPTFLNQKLSITFIVVKLVCKTILISSVQFNKTPSVNCIFAYCPKESILLSSRSFLLNKISFLTENIVRFELVLAEEMRMDYRITSPIALTDREKKVENAGRESACLISHSLWA